MDTVCYNCEILSHVSEMVSISCVHTSVSNSLHQQSLNSSSYNCSSIDSSLCKHEHSVALNLSSKGIYIGHLNIQRICGEKLDKISESEVFLSAAEKSNVHIFGLRVTKLKDHKPTNAFKINGFQIILERIITVMAAEV